MALKFRYKSKEEVPAEALALYTERDGAFVLDVEGAVDKSRVDEVRSSNVALTNQLAEQRKRFEAIESEQVKTIAAERDSLNAKLTAIQVNQGVLTVATKKGLRQRTNGQTRTRPKKYSVDFQRLTQIRKNIFRSPPAFLTSQNPQFFSQPPLLQQVTAKRFFRSGFPYIWRDKFSPPAPGAANQN